ncbi:MAG: OprO/OprP family phosphate-selective porin [Planctomycetes bacterium]|nr:OprO/OprP family phosphate-selective porin [Planctomycetota bacterium]
MRLLTWPVAAIALLLAASQAPAQSGNLEDRVKALEAKQTEKEKAGGAKGGDMVGAWFDDGLRFKTDNGSFEGRLGAYVIVHYTTHLHLNESDGKIDGYTVKEAGVELDGRLWQAWEVYVRPRIMPGGTDLYYGWVEFNKWECIKVRVGVMKEPYSPETMEDRKWMDMPEDSLLSLTAPGRDLGAMIHGSPLDGIVNYSVGVFNGNGTKGDENSDKDLAARLAFRPGAKSESEVLKHLTIGGSLTWGRANRDGVTAFNFETPATGTNFHPGSATGSALDGRVNRFGVDVSWVWGALSVKAEYSYFKARVNFAATDSRPAFRAHSWYGQVGFWILGSTRVTNHRPDIKKPLFNGGVGDVQVIGRVSNLRIDDTYEEHLGFTGSRSVTEFALGVNYYPNAYVRISAMFVQYRYDHKGSRQIFSADGRHFDDENAIIIRAQVDF